MDEKKFLEAYSKILKKLGISEIDERVAFKDNFVEKILGYSHTDGEIDFEEQRTDLSIYDNEHNKVVVIETKKSTENTRTLKEKWEDYAFRYKTAYTKYVILTNFKRIILYKNDANRTVLADLYMDVMLHRGKTIKSNLNKLMLEERRQIGEFSFLSKEELWDEKRYSDPNEFEEVYGNRTGIKTDSGFEDLLVTLEKCMFYLKIYTLKKFGEYEEKLEESNEIIEEYKNALEVARKANNENAILHFEQKLIEAEEMARIYFNFQKGFKRWIKDTGRPSDKEEDKILNKELFCEESIYILLGRILFIRICEDKGLLKYPIVSNGGVRRFMKSRTHPTFRWLWDNAIEDGKHIYSPIYEEGIFDWYRNGNSRFDDILRRIFWHLNHYDFSVIERDILGNLYERHFPPDKQSKLGGHYTQKPIVRYILDEVGYTLNNSIRNKSLIDIGCGSGTFIAEAMSRYIQTIPTNMPVEGILEEMVEYFRGFDIDSFSVTIAQIELIFKLIDTLAPFITDQGFCIEKRLKIFQTDSLKIPEPIQIYTPAMENERVMKYIRQKKEIIELKKREHDFVVGNPPYVQREITKEESEYYREKYEDSCYGELNLYRLFLHRIIYPKYALLKIGGKLGYITANTWIADKYAWKLRKVLLKNYKIPQVLLIPEKAKPFRGVTQATTIMILERINPPTENEAFDLENPENNPYLNYDVVIREIKDIGQLETREFKECVIPINKIVHGEDFDYAFLFSSNPVSYYFKDHLWENSLRLEEFLDEEDEVKVIHEGEIHLRNYKKNLRDSKEGNIPLIRGDDVHNFFVNIPRDDKEGCWFEPDNIDRPQSKKPRIIWGEIANMSLNRRIQAGIVNASEESPVLAGNTTCYMRLADSVDVNYILGLLNSTTLNMFFKLYSSNNHVKTREIRRLPIKNPEHNPTLAKKISSTVRKICKKRGRLEEAESLIKNPNLLIEHLDDTQLTKIYHSAFINELPSQGLSGRINLYRRGNNVHVTLNDKFSCSDENVAKYIFYNLKNVSDLTDIFNFHIPKDVDEIRRFNKNYEKAVGDVRNLPDSIEKLMNKLDEMVFELYEITNKEIDLVKEYCHK